jgi:multisubunit Na+/H+ antiporter MnhG subunit
MRKLKKIWHQLCFVGAVIIAIIARNYWASALVFAVGIFIIAPVEIRRLQKSKSQNFIKQKNIRYEKISRPIAHYQLPTEHPLSICTKNTA